MDIQTDNSASSRLTDPIDLDNKMRVVYRKRVESAQQFRHSVCLGDIDQSRLKTVSGTKDAGEKGSDKPTLSGMGAAMERLRSEMVRTLRRNFVIVIGVKKSCSRPQHR